MLHSFGLPAKLVPSVRSDCMALQSSASSLAPAERMAEGLRPTEGASFISQTAASAASPASDARHTTPFLPVHTRQKIAKEAELVESIELRLGANLLALPFVIASSACI